MNEQVGRYSIQVAGGRVTISGKRHSDTMDRAALVGWIAFYKRLAAKPYFGVFYTSSVAAHERALALLDGGGA